MELTEFEHGPRPEDDAALRRPRLVRSSPAPAGTPAPPDGPAPGVLATVASPADLKRLAGTVLPTLAAEIRDFLVRAVSRTGGHLGSNLGVVELTIALHRVFDSPRDTLIWDVGHQAYVHKLLTGRRVGWDRLRTAGGLSGYPSRAESPHDHVESSHASSSLSWADGIAHAYTLTGQDRRVVAVVGDGALTGGMAWEALNNIAARRRPGADDTARRRPGADDTARRRPGADDTARRRPGADDTARRRPGADDTSAASRNVVVVVNDNGRSYLPTIGGLADRLATLRLRPDYEGYLAAGTQRLRRTPVVGRAAYAGLHALKTGLKDAISPQVLFGDLGLKCLGPVDGHDIGALESALARARDFGGPVVVHVVTRKGHGYAPAENDETEQMHSPPAFDAETGRSSTPKAPTWTDVFAEEIVRIGHRRPDVVAITAAMLHPTGLGAFRRAFPERCIDVGIAEQHALTSAAGLARGGMHPVVTLYSTFLNRAFDQLMMDVALHREPVTLVLDRSGVTGSDGPTHNGMWDLSLLGVVPGMRVAAPRDAVTLREELAEALAVDDGPTAVRYPKGPVVESLPALHRTGGVDVLWASPGPAVLVVCAGAFGELGVEVARVLARRGVAATVADPRWVLPIPDALVAMAAAHPLVVTIADSGTHGGFGSALADALRAGEVDVPQRDVALPQEFLEHGSRAGILAEHGITAGEVADRIAGWLSARPPVSAS